ncbi:MAG TPA: NAD-dependent protein deacetylase [Gammaproteobacteria bacterium]
MPADALRRFVHDHRRLFVLTGAGCSTDSGIPDYRDADGAWKRKPPVMLRDFLKDELARKRYWARGLVGWERFHRAAPNAAHRALARLEQQGRIELLVTQNVDGLHRAAGSVAVVELHGRADRIRCVSCGVAFPRAEFHRELRRRNPGWAALDAAPAPDGDADLDSLDFASFDVPACARCGGVLKTDVVYFGESVPRERVAASMAALRRADAMLVVGSSLMVYSGYRFALAAAELGKPIAAVNLGRTRADHLLTLKVTERCAQAFEWVEAESADGAAAPRAPVPRERRPAGALRAAERPLSP